MLFPCVWVRRPYATVLLLLDAAAAAVVCVFVGAVIYILTRDPGLASSSRGHTALPTSPLHLQSLAHELPVCIISLYSPLKKCL